MATNRIEASVTGDPERDSQRIWQEFAIRGFATIVARKHNIVVPLEDVKTLSDEDLAARLRLVSELAHLPPA